MCGTLFAFRLTRVEDTPGNAHVIGAEGVICGAALVATLIETEALIAALTFTAACRAFIDVTIAVVVDVVARLRWDSAACPAAVSYVFINNPITVIICKVTDFRVRLLARDTACSSSDASPGAESTATG